jgi:hypothetical protein
MKFFSAHLCLFIAGLTCSTVAFAEAEKMFLEWAH